jgi:hypothetical protein
MKPSVEFEILQGKSVIKHLFLTEPPTVEELEPPFTTPFQERLANQHIAFPCPAKGV